MDDIGIEIKKRIIYEDTQLLAINKPSNLLTIQDGYVPDLPHLLNLLRKYYPKIWVIHRLDKQTTGAMLFAKNAVAHKALSLQFQNRLVEKEYHCITFGKIDWDEKWVEIPLLVNGDRKHRTVPNPVKGKPAATRFKLIGSNGDYSLLAAFPQTGYRHQIRSHLRYLDLEILLDDLYGKKTKQASLSYPIQRLALHACQIGFKHPVSNKFITLNAPIPEDFIKTLFKLQIKS